VIDIAWDSARRTFKSSTQSIHQICGQSIELVLKASVASRTLDNITGVIVAFKSFRKTLKAEFSQKELQQSKKLESNESFRSSHLNQLLFLPNVDLSFEDVEKPSSMAKSMLSLEQLPQAQS
jgi:hypothetical protein